MTLVLRVKYPPTWPGSFKTICLLESITVRNAIKKTAEIAGCVDRVESNFSFYVEEEDITLDADEVLSEYSDLLEYCDTVEIREIKSEEDEDITPFKRRRKELSASDPCKKPNRKKKWRKSIRKMLRARDATKLRMTTV
mmetsp:Transcript_28051/g.31186  ORF Transcript_28051/g.31186 Transcript_28051/m.31186 type:complete len:139 (-) Transcript_28051:69-485(-)|eukprot:CAMPEP_0168519140 /NCGR_PEP_ID=MMETSP0405-20121227/7141_1 /TAXON_ID=498012 /ORGANISM="Trichosphaerium sp, Strain Am-I-7 wt" /LENGTH=138 /DNA_ID=CAMNT_0008539627 /DNA_START=61 /DNA_END=477 /DNA_ORIENTATION=+